VIEQERLHDFEACEKATVNFGEFDLGLVWVSVVRLGQMVLRLVRGRKPFG
jgi:hypothetical protein